jgi:LPXTG-site transpeptidase (sortase) family protein
MDAVKLRPTALPNAPTQANSRPMQSNISVHTEPVLSPKQQPRLARMNVLTAMAAVVFLLGVGVSLNSFLTNRHVTQQVKALAGSDAGDQEDEGSEEPDETAIHPNAVSSYKVAPDLPRKISISKLKITARIKPLGVNRNNQLLAPTSIFDAGWYNASAKPGIDAGAVLIDGHVHGPTKPGIFGNLKKLTPGDIVDIERGDGKVIQYKVEKTEQVLAQGFDMGRALTSVRPGKQGLNIVTCTGSYGNDGHYEDRLIVYAVQVD